MHKVLLVDDEMFVRKGLLNLIDWEAQGYVVAAEADNGEEALRLIPTVQPDLVITDIRMPVLDGLELIRAVSEQGGYQPAFIIISGYHDFKYAQQALRYGVHDYILKPIDEEELEQTLSKLSPSLSMKKLHRLNKEKSVGESLLQLLISGSARPEDERELADALQVTSSAPYSFAVFEPHANGSSAADTPDAKLVADAMAHASAMGTADASAIPWTELPGGRLGLLIDSRRLQGHGGKLELFLRALHSSITKQLGISAAIYAGKPVDRITRLIEAYQTAVEAAQYKFALDGSPVICYEQVQETPLYVLDMDSELYKQLLQQLEEQQQEGFQRAVDQMFQQFQYKRFAPSAVVNVITRCVIQVIQLIKEMEGDETQLEALPDMLDWQHRSLSPKGVKELFIRFMTQAAQYMDQLRKEQAKGGIQKIKKYIEAHYTENISLKSIAAAFYMNPVYLGQLFRKTYGFYFNDFLLHLRIDEAKKLLRQTDQRIYEIAQRVGFQNPDYFVTQFEKLEHLTPTEYRNKIIGNER
jgi:two-component system, response regulator YesN